MIRRIVQNGSWQSRRSAHFGFRTVEEQDKEQLVGNVFSSIAKKYDKMNDYMSFGVHRLWKDHFVERLQLQRLRNPRILDVAGGTGDIAFRMARNMKNSGTITVIDINEKMLSVGRKRAQSMNVNNVPLQFVQGNAEALDMASDSVDLYTIAFGIRNCTHLDKVLEEAYRVLKPGGVFSCLEFSKVHSPLLSLMYKQYSFNIIPLIGQIVAADRDSYQYLVESIERFPSQQEFLDMIKAVGFEPAFGEWEDLSGGIAAIHTAVKV